MKAKRFPLFYIFLLLLIAVVLIGTEIGKSHLTKVLEAYENSQYKYVAEDFLDSHFVPGNGEALAQLFASQISEMEAPQSAAKALGELTEGKGFSLQSVSTGLTDTIEYAIKCDGKRLASLTLEKSDTTDSYGFALYEVKDCTLNEKLLFSRTLMAPLGYTVRLGELEADERYCGTEIVYTDHGDQIPGNVVGIPYATYTFNALLSEPVFTVLSANGTPAAVTMLESGVYCAAPVFDLEMPSDLHSYAIEATKAYACYLQKDARLGEVAKYMDKTSQLYENIRTSPNWMVIDHNSYDFADPEVSEYYVYDDTSFSCRVTLTHILKYRGLQDYRDYIDITWYFTQQDGKYLIYDSFNNN